MTESDSRFEPIAATGTAWQVGRAFGSVNGESIRAHLQDFMQYCAREGLDELQLLDKAQAGLQIVRAVAPWWETEMNAVSEAAGVATDLYKAFCIGKYRRLFFGPAECTSYAATGSHVPFAGSSFHKSRDSISRLQCAFVRRVQDPVHELYAWCGTSDTSDPTTMMFVNEHGLAGSADTGGRTEDFHGEGLMNTFGLRYIAESCRDCQEAADTLQHWSEARYYAGGNIKTNWMFSDAAGTILRAVQDNYSVEAKFTTEGIVTNCERKRLVPTLLRQAGHLDAIALNEASRINSVSMASTISSMSVDCLADDARYLTCAWFALGRPSRAPYLPVFVASGTVPRAMLDGSLYRRSLPGRASAADMRKLELGWKARADECLQQVGQLISTAQIHGIGPITQQVTAECLQEAFAAMPGDV